MVSPPKKSWFYQSEGLASFFGLCSMPSDVLEILLYTPSIKSVERFQVSEVKIMRSFSWFSHSRSLTSKALMLSHLSVMSLSLPSGPNDQPQKHEMLHRLSILHHAALQYFLPFISMNNLFPFNKSKHPLRTDMPT